MKNNDIDIISCATDTIAAGAIEAIHTYAGSQIPKNVRYGIQIPLYIGKYSDSGYRIW